MPSYLIVVPVAAYRIGDGSFAIESAFAEHLQLLRTHLAPLASNMVIAAPSMADEVYQKSKSNLAVIRTAEDGIRFSPLFPNTVGRLGFLALLPGVLVRLFREVRAAEVVHTGPSSLHRMFEFPAFLMGVLAGKVTIGVSDIDERGSLAMNLKTGRWNLRQYWTNRLIHQPITHFQHAVIAKFGSLVLYKGAAFARDYGRGRANVKNFFNAAFSVEDVISPDELEAKRSALAREETELRICYFGRLVAYKGVDHILGALAHARVLGLKNFRFDVFGDGEERRELENLADRLGLSEVTRFHGALPFGREFLRTLRDQHLLLAAPLSEDTPRSALDAMASGQAVLAYDTYYYRDLESEGAGVQTVPWFEPDALGGRLAELAKDRRALVQLIEKSVAFAHDNTQEIWLDRRVGWTREASLANSQAFVDVARLDEV